MIVTVAVMLASAAPQAQPTPATPAAPRCTAAQVPECLAGSWSGLFTGAEWTFKFTREGGAWAGRYRSSRGKGWHSLLGLEVAGDAITFGIEAQPAVTYRLKLDPVADTLSGTVEISGLATLPFTAARRS